MTTPAKPFGRACEGALITGVEPLVLILYYRWKNNARASILMITNVHENISKKPPRG